MAASSLSKQDSTFQDQDNNKEASQQQKQVLQTQTRDLSPHYEQQEEDSVHDQENAHIQEALLNRAEGDSEQLVYEEDQAESKKRLSIF